MPASTHVTTFTVFTPTYNRARTLHRVWESLQAQTFRNFEWLVVDDGSTDNSRELVEGWAKIADFPVRYFWQENQHKKVAFNRAVREAQGELLLVLDSDDACVPEALERLKWHWDNIPAAERNQFTAVTALCKDTEGNLVGDRFPGGEWIDSNGVEIYHRWRVRGEKWGFQRTDVLKQFPFPEDERGLVPEGYVWSQLDQSYKTRFVNEMLRVYYRDQEDSLIACTTSNPASHANGQVLAEFSELRAGVKWFWHDPLVITKKAANLVRLILHCSLSHEKLKRLWSLQPAPAKALLMATAPIGVLVWARDRLRHG